MVITLVFNHHLFAENCAKSFKILLITYIHQSVDRIAESRRRNIDTMYLFSPRLFFIVTSYFVE
jgi:hypothetical protein